METEEEQVEKLKKWLKDNGMSIVAGIVIGIGGLGGYRYWIEFQESEAQQASTHFVQMIDAIAANNSEEVQNHAQILIEEYASTDYSMMARLAQAKDYVANAEFDKAVKPLQEVIGTTGQQPLAFIARTRLAAVLMQLGENDQALTTLSAEFPQEFAAAVAELRGDILSMQGKPEEAAEAYRLAQQASPGPANSQLLQQKVDDLGVAG
ncbi:MAG: putative negative regulator of RcsB-dependent stress response [Gammaproteobacteria bacterium]|jgi:predicted negative regulator of RcsB-dependent stress response